MTEQTHTPRVRLLDVAVENVKRINEVAAEILPTGLTIVGGKNTHGKTSFIDAIAWDLGGDRFKPTSPARNGKTPYIKIRLDNGYTVERAGKNSALKVTCPEGKAGVAALREFISPFALDLSKFMAASEPEKIKILLAQFPELGKQLDALVCSEKALYDERHKIGVIADSKTKYAENLAYDEFAPDALADVSEITARLTAAHAEINRQENCNAKRAELKRDIDRRKSEIASDEAAIKKLMGTVELKKTQLEKLVDAHEEMDIESLGFPMPDTSEIERELAEVEIKNTAYRHNESKRQAAGEAAELREKYEKQTTEIEEIRAKQRELLKPLSGVLDGLSLADGCVKYNDQQWDCMSTAEQYKVATAICSRLNPSCGFVLIDRLETMDTDTLAEFGAWLTERGLQAIGTRVSTGDECTFIIEDGNRKEEF